MRLIEDDDLAPAHDLAAVSHIGRTHATNEDAVAIGRRVRDGAPLQAIVVCDGVSTSSHGEQASAHAAKAALAVLLKAADDGGPLDAATALGEAMAAAHRAACEADIDLVPGKAPPGTTIVAALAYAGRIDVAWVGDSRAYLVSPPSADRGASTATVLTHDHSWINMVVDAGQMTEDEAEHSPYAHAITHCIGPLETSDPDQPAEPSLSSATPESGSRLIVCSDGLWNYAPTPADITAIVVRARDDADARTIADELVQEALARGGHDDVTVAVAFL